MICPVCHTPSAEFAPNCVSCTSSMRLRDRFELRGQLGEGAQGVTWLGHDRQSGQTVAIKEFSVRKAQSLKAMELFEREAATLRDIEHPGIPRWVDDFVVEHDRDVAMYLVQEYIEGDALPMRTRWTDADVGRVCADLCDVLAYLHERRPPVIHRDIKPSNVMLRPDGRLVLIDFGAVKSAVDASGALGGSTVAGTFGYMAPEQLRGVASPSSDLYSVGALAVALLSGRDASELIDLAQPGGWARALPMSPAMRRVLERLLELDQSARCDDAREAAALFRGVAQEQPRVPAERHDASVAGSVATASPASPAAASRWRLRLAAADLRWSDALNDERGIFPLVILPVVASFFAVAIVAAALRGAFRAWSGGIVVPDTLPLAVSLIAPVALGYAAFAARAVWRPPLVSHPISKAIRSTWPASASWAVEATLWLRQKSRRRRERTLLDRLAVAGVDDVAQIPVLESHALALSSGGRDAEAASVLGTALETGASIYGAASVVHACQKVRYAPLRYRSLQTRAAAVAEHDEGVNALASIAVSECVSTAEVVRRAAVEVGGGTRPETAGVDVEAGLRRMLFRERIAEFATSPVLVVSCVLVMLIAGAFIRNRFGMSWTSPAFLGGGAAAAAVLVGVIILGLSLRRRGDGLASLGSDLAVVWPTDHPLYGQVVEGTSLIWTRHGRYQPRRTVACLRALRSLPRAVTDSLSDAQRAWLAALDVFSTPHFSEVAQRVETLQQYPVSHPGRRAYALEYAALVAASSTAGRLFAQRWMLEATSLRNGALSLASGSRRTTPR